MVMGVQQIALIFQFVDLTNNSSISYLFLYFYR